MSVKKKDRHISKGEALGKARELVSYTLILTRPRQFDENGKQIQKPGILGEGQPLQVFGIDIVTCAKRIHAACYEAYQINLKNEQTLIARNEYHLKAIEYCKSILRMIDFCINQYAKNNKKKRNSFEHLAHLTKIQIDCLQDRINRDKLIFEHNYKAPKIIRRGR